MAKEQIPAEPEKKFSSSELQSFYKNNTRRANINFLGSFACYLAAVRAPSGALTVCFIGLSIASFYRGVLFPHVTSNAHKTFIETQILKPNQIATLTEFNELAIKRCNESPSAAPTYCVENFRAYILAAKMGAPSESKSAFIR
jgi:hypothetical protein